jgi:hypothetical protein
MINPLTKCRFVNRYDTRFSECINADKRDVLYQKNRMKFTSNLSWKRSSQEKRLSKMSEER